MGTNTINGDKVGINSFEMTMNRLICESEILIWHESVEFKDAEGKTSS